MQYRKWTLIPILLILMMALPLAVDRHIFVKGSEYIVSPQACGDAQVAIVLGAYVFPDGRLCDMLADRVKTAVELYNNGYANKILMTGDNGKEDYDEVNYMRLYAESLGVPTEDIFMDHAGFSTYDSMYRARDIFQVNSAIIVTQEFHLPRATYTARTMGIDAVGVVADKRPYTGIQFNESREILARLKAFGQIHVVRSKPRFLGEVLSIDGDGRVTHDDFRVVTGK